MSVRSASSSSAEAGLDDLDEPQRGRQVLAEAPDAAVVVQVLAAQGADHQLAEEQHVARRPLGELPGRGRVDRAAQRPGQQLAHVVGLERADVDAGQDLVLPQGDDRVGGGLTAGHGGHDRGHTGGGGLVDQGGGGVVEQVGVVDEQQQRLAVGALGQAGHGPAQQVDEVVDRARRRRVPGLGAVAAGGEQGSEGAERQLGRRTRRGDLGGRHAGALRDGERLVAEAGLAGARRPGKTAPRGDGAPQELAERPHFFRPPNERPVRHGREFRS